MLWNVWGVCREGKSVPMYNAFKTRTILKENESISDLLCWNETRWMKGIIFCFSGLLQKDRLEFQMAFWQKLIHCVKYHSVTTSHQHINLTESSFTSFPIYQIHAGKGKSAQTEPLWISGGGLGFQSLDLNLLLWFWFFDCEEVFFLVLVRPRSHENSLSRET